MIKYRPGEYVYLESGHKHLLNIPNTNKPGEKPLFIFLKILFIFRERRREQEREGEKHQYVVVSHVPTTGDLAYNRSTCPDWELNW